MTYASDKNAWGISDRSGFRYRLRDMKKEWTGALVGPDEYEPKHPQLYPPKVGPDPQALHEPRPDQRTESSVANMLPLNAFASAAQGSGVITVTEPSHGRTTGNTVRFRSVAGFDGFSKTVLEQAAGYVITVITTNTYTFTAASGTATTGNQRGGGGVATAGPVTLVV